MRTLLKKPLFKFCIGLVAYALIVWGVSFFAVMCLGVVTFAMALWACCKGCKPVAAILLIISITAQGYAHPGKKDQPPEPQPKVIKEVCVAGVVILVGYVIVKNLWKICKKLPAPNPPNNPPATNVDSELVFMSPATVPMNNAPQLVIPIQKNIASNAWDVAVLKMQCSTNGRDWRDAYTISNWFFDTQGVSIIYSNSVPLQTNFYTANFGWNFTNAPTVVDFSSALPRLGQEAVNLWRAVVLE